MNLDGNFPSYEQQEAIKTSIANINTQIANKNASKILKSKTYTSNGTFTVPVGVVEVYVTGCGGGGGGDSYTSTTTGGTPWPAASGGITSFGALLSLSGGGAGIRLSGGTGAGNGGGGGRSVDNVQSAATVGTGGAGFSGGNAGYGAKGATGDGGGGGSYNNVTSLSCGGGGAGEYVRDYAVSVSPGSTHQITIGRGGIGGYTGSSNSVPGGKGGDGILTVKWWE